MGQIVDIGRRIELVPMDPQFHDITIALYRQETAQGPAFLVHTYSQREKVSQRIASVVQAMHILGGMVLMRDGRLRFPCWADHELACKRIFLEACKLDASSEIEPRPLTVLDKKSGLNITVSGREGGIYHVTADGDGRRTERRISAIAGGLMKLGEMEERAIDQVTFPCGHFHDAMVGLLLVRAPNVRAVMREQKMTASRGVLSAPSQQN